MIVLCQDKLEGNILLNFSVSANTAGSERVCLVETNLWFSFG